MNILSPVAKGRALRDGDVVLICLYVCSFVRLSVANVYLSAIGHSAYGRERPQHCRTTRTTGVPDVSCPW